MMSKNGKRKGKTNFRTNLRSVEAHPRHEALSLRLDSLPGATAPDWNLCESRHAGSQHEGLRFQPHPELVPLRLPRRAPSPANCAPSPDHGRGWRPLKTHWICNAQEATMIAPRRPKRRPRESQNGPAGSQDSSRGPPRRPKRPPRRPQSMGKWGGGWRPLKTWEIQRAGRH